MDETENHQQALKKWTTASSKSGIIRHEAIELKARGRSFKSVSLNYYGNDPEQPSKRELQLQEVPANTSDWGYAFDNPASKFKLIDDEIAVLQKFLNGMFPEDGYYLKTDSNHVASMIGDYLRDNADDSTLIAELLQTLGRDPEALRAVSSSSQAGRLASVIENERHAAAIAELDCLARAAGSTEHSFQRILQENAWIFGGRYVGLTDRRNFTVLDQLDVPLVGVDGSLHVVELKTAEIPRLFRQHRNHWIVGTDVHEAVAQAQNYLFSLDSEAHSIAGTLQIDAYRSFATVIIGHLDHCTTGATEVDASRALRVYNSHLSRVRVITYDQLIANARNAIKIGSAGLDSGA